MNKSHRQVFRSSAIMGGTSVVTITIGIIKVKVLAILLGPAGVGLMGLYQSIIGVASSLAGCGISESGVRQLAVSTNETSNLAIVRRTLWISNLFLGLIGMTILWLFREQVALWVFGSTAHIEDIRWIGLGVLLTLIAGSQTALLQGLRRIVDLARVNIISSLIGASVGILLVSLLGQEGVIWFVIVAPSTSIMVAGYYAAKLPRIQTQPDWQAIRHQSKAMLKLGIPLMIATLVTLVTQLATRSIILREIDLDANGYFQAAWTISMTYIGFVLGAMSTDYFPRLTASISDHALAKKLVNEQTEIALLLSGPVLLVMVTLAPWVIHLLYAENFMPATEILRWQVIGDILKVASWPMGFILIAMGRGGAYIFTQLTWNAIYLASIALGIKSLGLVITGISFLLAYMVFYSVLILFSNKLIGYKTSRRIWLHTIFLLITSGFIMTLATQSAGMEYIAGVLAILAASIYSLKRLDHLMDLRGWLGKAKNNDITS